MKVSIGTPFLVIECDCCGAQVEEDLIKLASRDAWSDRHVKDALKRQGWKIDGDILICSDCQEEDA